MLSQDEGLFVFTPAPFATITRKLTWLCVIALIKSFIIELLDFKDSLEHYKEK